MGGPWMQTPQDCSGRVRCRTETGHTAGDSNALEMNVTMPQIQPRNGRIRRTHPSREDEHTRVFKRRHPVIFFEYPTSALDSFGQMFTLVLVLELSVHVSSLVEGLGRRV